jgi:hypothetical protein
MPNHQPIPPELPAAIRQVAGYLPDVVQELLSLFAFDHLPPRLREISEPFACLAADMVNNLNPGYQLLHGLQKLLAVKDCMVRQRLLDDTNKK